MAKKGGKSTKCSKCGFLNNPDDVHYCGKCGFALSGKWKVFDAGIYKPVSKLTVVASEMKQEVEREQIEKLEHKLKDIETIYRQDVKRLRKEIDNLKMERDRLRSKLGNRIADLYIRHLDYLLSHKPIYYVVTLIWYVLLFVMAFWLDSKNNSMLTSHGKNL